MSYDGLFIINSGQTNDQGHVYGGKDQFGYEAVEFLKLGRTIKVVGNTTIGGDISARDFVVGGGKYTTYPNYSGQVIFSDTPGADTGSNTLIRNWNYKNDNVRPYHSSITKIITRRVNCLYTKVVNIQIN